VRAHPLDRVPRTPRTCILEITRRCNLRCVHCGNNSGDESPRELSREQFRALARELAELGCRHVEVTGGEPLLHPEWDGLCADYVAAGLRVAIISNGTLLDEYRMGRAIEVGVAAVGLSLDGMQATHDRIRLRPGKGPSPWKEAVAAIERSLPRLETVVITAVCRQIHPEQAEVVRLIRRLAADQGLMFPPQIPANMRDATISHKAAVWFSRPVLHAKSA